MIQDYNENIEFELDDYVNKKLAQINEANKVAKRDSRFGLIVCSHWLVGLCASSECGYLHRLDKSKMPRCPYGKSCKVKNCLKSHIDEDAKPECPFFRQGFCMHGPFCRYKHIKLLPEECPEVANFDVSVTINQDGGGGNVVVPAFKKARAVLNTAEGAVELYKVTLCKYWKETGKCPFKENCHYAHGEAELKEVKGGSHSKKMAHMPAVNLAQQQPDYYTGEAAGFMFHCTPPMIAEIFQKRLLAVPAHLKDIAVGGIAVNAPLFFYDTVNQMVFGLYTATSGPTEGLDPLLFGTTGGGVAYPVQVRFAPVLDAAPVSEKDPELYPIFGGMKGSPRVGPMSMQDTRALANVFARRCGAMPAPKPNPIHNPAQNTGYIPGHNVHGPPGARGGPPPHTHGTQIGAPSYNPSAYRPPLAVNEAVFVNVPYNHGNIADLKRKLIGQSNEIIFQLVKELGGQHKVRLRLRGQGSGFREGAMELQEPLQFNVAADSDATLARAVERVKEHIERVRQEMM